MEQSHWIEIGIALGLCVGMVLALELGAALGGRRSRTDEDPSHLGAIQGAVLGLLGLLLGFSFAGAATRFVDRQDVIVREANAIGTAYLRADLLPEPQRGELRAALVEYTAARIELFERERDANPASALERCEALHERIWAAASAGVRRSPEFDETVLPPVNEVIDLHTTRAAAERRHLPGLVLVLLIVASAVAVAVVGYGAGLMGRGSRPLGCTLALLLALTLWVTIDLDYPRHGLIRINQQPLLDLQRSLR